MSSYSGKTQKKQEDIRKIRVRKKRQICPTNARDCPCQDKKDGFYPSPKCLQHWRLWLHHYSIKLCENRNVHHYRWELTLHMRILLLKPQRKKALNACIRKLKNLNKNNHPYVEWCWHREQAQEHVLHCYVETDTAIDSNEIHKWWRASRPRILPAAPQYNPRDTHYSPCRSPNWWCWYMYSGDYKDREGKLVKADVPKWYGIGDDAFGRTRPGKMKPNHTT